MNQIAEILILKYINIIFMEMKATQNLKNKIKARHNQILEIYDYENSLDTSGNEKDDIGPVNLDFEKQVMFDKQKTSKYIKTTTYYEKKEPQLFKKSDPKVSGNDVVKTLESSQIPLNDSKNLTSHGNFDTNSSVLDKSIEDDILHFKDLKKQSSKGKLKKLQSASAKVNKNKESEQKNKLENTQFGDNKKSVPQVKHQNDLRQEQVVPEDSEKLQSILSLGPSNNLSAFSEFLQIAEPRKSSSPHKDNHSHKKVVLDMKQGKDMSFQSKSPKRKWSQLAKQCAIDSQPPDEITMRQNKLQMQESITAFMKKRAQRQQPESPLSQSFKRSIKHKHRNKGNSPEPMKEYYDLQMNRKITGLFQSVRKNKLTKAPNHGFLDLDNPCEVMAGVRDRFKSYTQRFLDLTKRSFVDTYLDVIDVTISNDSKLAIAILSDEDTCLIVRWYSLETDEDNAFVDHIGELHIDGDFFVKAKQVSQDQEGKLFLLPYLEDGIFFMQIFNEQGEIQTININELLKLESLTTPIFGFPDPLINCVFCNDKQIFINLFHNYSQTNWHFMYSYQEQKMIGKPIGTKMNCLHLNFPCHSFFDQTNQKIYCFYRQGQTFTVDVNDTSIIVQQQIEVGDFGQMYILYDKILMARSSNMIYFYKREQIIEQDVAKLQWVQYDQLDIRGMIYYTKDQRFQITTDKLIYFYFIDEKTLKPELENCLYNFMGCSQMMFGPRLMYCITYKTGQTGFNIYKKRYIHKFLAKLSSQTFEGSFGVNVDSKNQILITSGQIIQVYCQLTYKLIDQFEVPFPPCQRHSGTHLKQQILNVQNSLNDDFIAVIVGHQFVQNETILYQLYIYKYEGQSWKLNTQRLFPDLIQNSSKWLTFNISNYDELFLVDKNQITAYNYVTQKYYVFYIFQNSMNSQPIYVKFNHDQTTAMIASFNDAVYIKFEQDHEQDIDEMFEISDIRSMIYAQKTKKYYLLANKCQELLGYYIIEFDESNNETNELEVDIGEVEQAYKSKVLLNWRSKLDIGNANLNLIFNEKEGIEQLIVSYKCIYINTYNVLVIDLKTSMVKYRHESFHLWESSMVGFVLKNNEFLMLSNHGFQVLGMSNRTDKIVLQDDYGQDWMLHHLESCIDLRLEASNHLLYTLNGKEMIISIQDQFEESFGNTVFEDIYTIKMQEMTLRESLLCQSIISCRQQYDVFKLIQYQPAPALFFKSFLELDKTNLVTILSFDSRSIIALLDQKHEHLFQSKYPVFYKTKVEGDKCISAIDTAIENNQIRATNSIINYIVKYQNNVVFCYLFEDNFVSLIEKGINVIDLLKSDIFFHRLDFMEWPSIHTDCCQLIRPYNGSMFKLRHNYSNIFQDFAKDQENDDHHGPLKDIKVSNLKRQLSHIHEQFVQKRIFKIKYNLSILPSVSEERVSLMDVLEDTQDLKIFDALAVEDLLDFKWHKYAKYVHFLAFGCHIIYMTFFSVYVNLLFVYNDHSQIKHRVLHIMMGLFLFFPLVYDMTQLKKQGFKVYFSSVWNYLDQGHIWIGYANIIHQIWFLEKYKDSDLTNPEIYENGSPYMHDRHRSELIMILVTLIMLFKTFFFLRIFIKLSNLVAMMSQVVNDLKVFILFYIILIWMFSLIFNILQMGNYDLSLRTDIQEITDLKVYPGQEYKYLPAWLRQCISVIRMSLADFDFGESGYLDPFENILFWCTWILILLLTCIVFLNFIIAEVSASYNKVTKSLHGLFLQERAQLIKESEDMLPSSWQQDINKFPKYLITREVEK